MEITHVIKRDFTTKLFHLQKITDAILKAMTAAKHGNEKDAKLISENVYKALLERKQQVLTILCMAINYIEPLILKVQIRFL